MCVYIAGAERRCADAESGKCGSGRTSERCPRFVIICEVLVVESHVLS
jgi:hypothetical protein